jgi:hypothetical protein
MPSSFNVDGDPDLPRLDFKLFCSLVAKLTFSWLLVEKIYSSSALTPVKYSGELPSTHLMLQPMLGR